MQISCFRNALCIGYHYFVADGVTAAVKRSAKALQEMNVTDSLKQNSRIPGLEVLLTDTNIQLQFSSFLDVIVKSQQAYAR